VRVYEDCTLDHYVSPATIAGSPAVSYQEEYEAQLGNFNIVLLKMIIV